MRWAYTTVINDTLFIGGGYCPTINDQYFMFSYKLSDDQWKKLPVLPQCRGVPTNIDNQLSCIGGRDYSTSKSTNKVITLQDGHWTTVYPNMIEAREDHAVVSYQQYTIVAGGVGEDQSTLNNIEVFNCKNYQWTIVPTHLPQPMRTISATTCNQSFIITGFTGADGRGNNGTYIISMDSLVGTEQQHSLASSTSEDDNKLPWSELCHTPYWATAIVPNTSPPVIIGGHDKYGKAVNNIILYDDSSNSWSTVSSLLTNRVAATVATIGNNAIIVAGGLTDRSSRETANATTLTEVELYRTIRIV